MHAAHAHAKLQRVSSLLPADEITKFPTAPGIDRVAHLRTAASECAANAKRRLGGIAETLAAGAIVLKARFVDHCWPQHCRLCQLQTLKREQ